MRQMAYSDRNSDLASEIDAVRLAEVVGSLSLATDLGNGQPLETALSCTLVAMGLGKAMGLSAADLEAVYWGGLLRFIGCTSTSVEESSFSGDDLELRSALLSADFSDGSDIQRRISQGLGRQLSPARRARAVQSFLQRGPEIAPSVLAAHCEVAVRLASRLGMPPTVQAAVNTYHERWDGGGPKRLYGESIPLATHVLDFAEVAVANARGLNPDELQSLLRHRSGGQLDPGILPIFLKYSRELFSNLRQGSVWDKVMEAEPNSHRLVPADQLGQLARILGDYSDLKTPFMLGHSRGVARLAVEAGTLLGLPQKSVARVELAALLHDLGRVSVPNGITDKPDPLSPGERERVRGHAYYTERILSASPALSSLGRLGASNHERLDGSGYPHGLSGSLLGAETRLLAVANWYEGALREKAYRPALSRDTAAKHLRESTRQGHFDARAVAAVLDVTGHKLATPAIEAKRYPAGLTEREVEVLLLVGRGLTNKEIASRLVISPRTVQQHTLHIYNKIGVSTRAAATLFAAEHDLFSPWT
ncbi:MAG: HD domain-containing protein [SAR202 cluster bacterium]|nr:HD domain-containing protein [SAR202 cluster bacterium]